MTTPLSELYDINWSRWVDMKKFGPSSRWLRFLVKRHLDVIQETDIRSVLDVGCGEGSPTRVLAEKFPNAHVFGIDFSKSSIDYAQASNLHANLSFFWDPNSDRLREKHDLITAFEVLEHVDDWEDLAERMAQSTRKYLMFSFPVGRMRPFEKNVGHVRNFQKGEMEAFLKRLGFKPLRIVYAGFPFYSPIYREICNINNAASSNFTTGRYSWKQKAVANILYILFKFFSTRKVWGDQFCGLFVKTQVE